MIKSFRSSAAIALVCSILFHQNYQHGVWAKEIEVTKEWQLLGENDTIPAGMHVRMDMTTGEKWVKQQTEDDDGESATSTEAAIIQGDGSIQVVPKAENDAESAITEKSKKGEGTYDFNMMHRTLSKLPDQEKERIGGLPELPQSTTSRKITSKERKEFESRMADIWERRQKELKELELQLMDMPKLLKERIKSIQEYLKDPIAHLNGMELDEEVPYGQVSHIVSVLQDLEYQLGDVDMSRDFHTLGGWPLLSSLLSEEVHVPQNKTISRLSRSMETKIRSVQSNAAWAMGTSVKNTAEFSPYAVEPFVMNNSKERTTAIDELIAVVCKPYDDPGSWDIRNLMGKAIYGIGSLLRGNRLAQAHIVKSDGAMRLGKTFEAIASDQLQTLGQKVVQKLLSLAGDIVSDIILHPEMASPDVNTKILESFTTSEWCGATATVLENDLMVAPAAQQTVLETVHILTPYCRPSWAEKMSGMESSIEKMKTGWEARKDTIDADHLDQLNESAKQAIESLKTS
ncbi:unnamed protein product [Cylindrotheca closterium]|uniref:Nucleotide exchange factor SIL1 n=1 Tax=Cylindrotheca closterium TaxID=2856 RepID=A0AAD2CGC7_9STRA|nr:unnamed protein product [Cylindrotheca closterium]